MELAQLHYSFMRTAFENKRVFTRFLRGGDNVDIMYLLSSFHFVEGGN